MAQDPWGNWTPLLPTPPEDVPSSGGGSGTTQVYTGAFDDPNGNVTPADTASAAIYTKDQSNPVQQWSWSVTNQNWFPTITA